MSAVENIRLPLEAPPTCSRAGGCTMPEVTVESHRWYSIVHVDGKFFRAFAGGSGFSGLGSFDNEQDFNNWREGNW